MPKRKYKPNADPKPVYHVRVGSELKAMLARYSQELDMPVASVIKLILHEYLTRQDLKFRNSQYQLEHS